MLTRQTYGISLQFFRPSCTPFSRSGPNPSGTFWVSRREAQRSFSTQQFLLANKQKQKFKKEKGAKSASLAEMERFNQFQAEHNIFLSHSRLKEAQRQQRDSPRDPRHEREVARLQAETEYAIVQQRDMDAQWKLVGTKVPTTWRKGNIPANEKRELSQLAETLDTSNQDVLRMKWRTVVLITAFAPLGDVSILLRIARILTFLGVCVRWAVFYPFNRLMLWTLRELR